MDVRPVATNYTEIAVRTKHPLLDAFADLLYPALDFFSLPGLRPCRSPECGLQELLHVRLQEIGIERRSR